ncbi:MAG: FAD-dependent oxidoreductase [Actinomycetia bacterium]|nr:FAD-dependent oxidoreductase [Actinomycetes bacterium]MCP4958259.1 FAD-dependent oxidoreductase [Actinomycetes bacterium]
MSLRRRNLDRIDGGHFDVLIVGGGINGAVSAAVLAGRGASVAVVDRGDFGAFTSQESSNLVWGGFKYLESYEMILVRKLCMSRNRLLKAYPDNVKPIGFLASLENEGKYSPKFAFMGALGYWAIGSFRTPRPRLLSSRRIETTEPVVDTTELSGGIEYFDAYLADNDSRFVFSFVRSAMDVGAAAANYVELVDAHFDGSRWQATFHDLDNLDEDGRPAVLGCTANTIVNAAGPFVDELNARWDVETRHRIVYSKGIHLIVPKLTNGNRVLAFFDDTGRLFYVIPMGRCSVIGTTDTRVDSAFTEVTPDDRQFLLDQINARLDLESPLTASDVIAERCGVRPLVVKAGGGDRRQVDWTKLSRKHEVEVSRKRKVVTVLGGKLTDCLNVGEEVAKAVERLGLPLEKDRQHWYGEPAAATREEYFRRARLMQLDDLRPKPDIEPLSERLWRRYGRRAFQMLDLIEQDPNMGVDVMDNADYLRVELHLAARNEMVTKLEDFMRRRSKIDLVVRDSEIRGSEGLAEVSTMLFGDRADEKLAEYLEIAPLS